MVGEDTPQPPQTDTRHRSEDGKVILGEGYNIEEAMIRHLGEFNYASFAGRKTNLTREMGAAMLRGNIPAEQISKAEITFSALSQNDQNTINQVVSESTILDDEQRKTMVGSMLGFLVESGLVKADVAQKAANETGLDLTLKTDDTPDQPIKSDSKPPTSPTPPPATSQ